MIRFWSKVTKTDTCWNWTGASAGGRKERYGMYYISSTRRMVYAHRFSYEIHFGSIPNGMHVMHTCDNTKCVRPDHLMVGTAADNAADKSRKGRAPRNGAKLHPEDIPVIRSRLAAGEFHQDIADSFGVSRPAISLIASGKNWPKC